MEQSLQKSFAAKSPQEAARAVSTSLPHVGRDDKDLARRALDHFQGAQDFRKQGNRSRYGDELKRVEVLLREIQKAPSGHGIVRVIFDRRRW
jgi:hypothetical protein